MLWRLGSVGKSRGRGNQGWDVLDTINKKINRNIYALVLANFGEVFFFFICKVFLKVKFKFLRK